MSVRAEYLALFGGRVNTPFNKLSYVCVLAPLLIASALCGAQDLRVGPYLGKRQTPQVSGPAESPTQLRVYPPSAIVAGYELQTLNIRGAAYASAAGISRFFSGSGIDAYAIYGSYADSSGNIHGFDYTIKDKIATTFDYPGASSTNVAGSDDNLDVVGFYSPSPDAPRKGFLYHERSEEFTSLSYPGAVETFASGVAFNRFTNETIVVGSYSDSSEAQHGFEYFPDDDSYVTVEYPGAVTTELEGVEFDNGTIVSVVGYYETPDKEAAFVLTFDNARIPIAYPGAAQTYAQAIYNGTVVGGYLTTPNGSSQGFVHWNWDGEPDESSAYRTVNYPGAEQTFVSAQELGMIVGSYGPDVDHPQAFLGLPIAYADLEPWGLNFASQSIGTKTQQTMTLTNASAADGVLDHMQMKLGGTNPDDFTVANNCPAALEQDQSCTITVTFDPLAKGARSASLSLSEEFSGNDGAVNVVDSPQVVMLEGTGSGGGGPAVTLSTASLKFPTQIVGTTSAASTVTLTNSGTATVSIGKIAATGDFAETNTCGASVTAGKSCTISVKFKPLASGALTGALSITDNASGSPQTVTLSGTGTFVSLTPATLSFPSTAVGKTSAAQAITVKNTGKTSLGITGGSTSANFQIASQTCKTTLAAGATCTYSIQFKPSAKGVKLGTFGLSDGGGGSPQQVILTGTGT